MPAEIEVAAQFGSPEASQALLPVFMQSMKPAAQSLSLHSLDPQVEQLSLLLRISGRFQKFSGAPAENVKFAKDNKWVSVDLLMSEAEWEGKRTTEIAAVLAGRLKHVPEVLVAPCKRRQLRFNEALLGEELAAYAKRMLEIAATL